MTVVSDICEFCVRVHISSFSDVVIVGPHAVSVLIAAGVCVYVWSFGVKTVIYYGIGACLDGSDGRTGRNVYIPPQELLHQWH